MKWEEKSFAGDKDKYIEYLKGDRKWNSSLYTDPDQTHYEGKASEFYCWIAAYLNAMECKYCYKEWNYEVVEATKGNKTPSGIKVTNKDKSVVMYLRSDQFGFTAPQGERDGRYWNNKYPYAKYLNAKKDCKEIEEDYKFVADVIWNTRSNGGSFIWPIINTKTDGIPRWASVYNVRRGVNSYIEDRVDLTLCEIKEFFNCYARIHDEIKIIEEMKSNNKVLLQSADSHDIVKWLSHFETFKNYVDFFSFESFMVEGTYNVRNLLTGEKIESDKIDTLKDATTEEIERVLKNLQKWTKLRNQIMLKKMKKQIL